MEHYVSSRPGDWYELYRTVQDDLRTASPNAQPPHELAAAMNEAFTTGELSFTAAVSYADTLTARTTAKSLPSETALAPLAAQFTTGQAILYEGMVDYDYHTPYHVGTIAEAGTLRPYIRAHHQTLTYTPTIEVTIAHSAAQETILLPIRHHETYAYVPQVALGRTAIAAYLSQQRYLHDTPYNKLPPNYSATDFCPRTNL